MMTTSPPLTVEEIRGHAVVLKESHEREALVVAAVALASSSQPEALARLGVFLQNEAFLARLDALDNPQLKLANVRRVLGALQAHPSQLAGKLCEGLAKSPAFMAEPDRKIFLLPALAAVRPMSKEAEAVFRQANQEGFWSSDGPLLMANGSPRALTLFAEMVADANVSEEDRIDMLHWAVPAHRLHAGVPEMAMGLLERGLPPEVEKAFLETLFDYKGNDWFGKAGNVPEPPPWSSGETSVLKAYLKLGQFVEQKRKPPPEVAAAVEKTLHEIRAILEARRKLEESKKPKP